MLVFMFYTTFVFRNYFFHFEWCSLVCIQLLRVITRLTSCFNYTIKEIKWNEIKKPPYHCCEENHFVHCFMYGTWDISRRILLEPGSSCGNRRSQLNMSPSLHLRQTQCHYIKELSAGYCSMNSWWRSPSAMSWRWRRCGWSNVMIAARTHGDLNESCRDSGRPDHTRGQAVTTCPTRYWMQFIPEYARRLVHACRCRPTPRTNRWKPPTAKLCPSN